MKRFVYLFVLVLFVKCSSSKNAGAGTGAASNARSYYTIQVYHMEHNEQVSTVENFLKSAWLPALHRNGIATVGVFKPVSNDTANDKRIFVFTPYNSLQQFDQVTAQMRNDITLEQNSPAYVNAAYNNPSFSRYETILMQAFDKMPGMEVPHLNGPKAQRVYELRSYEGPTEKLYENKVRMFNEGGEVPLFKRLNFNAVFYASVLAGSRMPNLMYMTTFENMAEREAHWKTFSDDPEWKALSSKDEYQHNVSKADIFLLTPTDYSDF
jgi:hypothetical protein